MLVQVEDDAVLAGSTTEFYDTLSPVDGGERQIGPSDLPNLSGLEPEPAGLSCVDVGFARRHLCRQQPGRRLRIEGVCEPGHAPADTTDTPVEELPSNGTFWRHATHQQRALPGRLWSRDTF